MRDDPPDKTTTVSLSHPYPCVETEECAATEVPEALVEVEALPTRTNLDASMTTTTRIAVQAGETTMTRSLAPVSDKIVVDTVVAAAVDTSAAVCEEVLSAPSARNAPNALIWDLPPVEDVEDVVTTMATQDRAETTSMFPSVASTNKMTLAESSASVESDLPLTAKTMATVKSQAIAVECVEAVVEATTEAAKEIMATRETSVAPRHYPITTANLEEAAEIMMVQAPAAEAITTVQAAEVVVAVTTMVPIAAVAEATSKTVCVAVEAGATMMAHTEALDEATSRTVCEAATAVAGSVDEEVAATIATSTTTMRSLVSMAHPVEMPPARGKITFKEDTTMAPEEPMVETLATTTTMTAVTVSTEINKCTGDVAVECAAVEADISMAPTEGATLMGAIDPATDKMTTKEMPRSKLSRDPAQIAEVVAICSCVAAAVAVAENSEVVVTSAEAVVTLEAEETSEATKVIKEVVPIWEVAEAMETKSFTTTKNEPAVKASPSRRDFRDEAASIRKSDDALKRKKTGLGRPQGPCLG